MDHIGEKQVIIGGKSNNLGEILEVTGFLGSAPAIERSLGFLDWLIKYPDVKVVKTMTIYLLHVKSRAHRILEVKNKIIHQQITEQNYRL